ncbi:substrate-binding periplasmic protein [Lacibacterium aquatile]|uniref:Substrate-binding periplasmic protein n=1 Tax=Lacibacterium aquatile TaxID=1168082 RepID=A0ABW5DV13_9PROT
MPKTRLFIATALLSLSVLSAQAQTKLKAGYFGLAPYAMDVGGKASGFAVDLVREKFVPATKIEVDFVSLPILRMLGELEAGNLDMVVLLAKNPEREAKFLFAAAPFYTDACALAVAKDSPLTTITGPADYAGKTVSINKGGYRCPSLAAAKDVTLDEMVVSDNLLEQLLRKAASGRVAGAHQPTKLAFQYVAQQIGIEAEVRFIDLPDPPQPLFAAFRKGIDPAIIAAYDKVNADAAADGSMAGFIGRYVKK